MMGLSQLLGLDESAGFCSAEFELCNPRESGDEIFSQRLEQILETMSHVDQTMIDVLLQT